MSSRRRGRGHGGGAPVPGPVVAAAASAPAPLADDLAPLAAPTPIEPAVAPALTTRDGNRSGSGDFRGRGGAPVRSSRPRLQQPAPVAGSAAESAQSEPHAQPDGQEQQAPKSGATLAQMRRFIKSRPYVPVHELRRRFLIEGMEDEVNPLSTGKETLYVGLPAQEAGFLGDLVRNGEVGCELLLDPPSPGVIGVFPMRPVARQ